MLRFTSLISILVVSILCTILSCSKNGSKVSPSNGNSVGKTPDTSATSSTAKLTIVGRDINEAQGIAVDNSGNIFVTQLSNSTVSVINKYGQVLPFAGNSHFGFADGVDTVASFNGPYGIVLDQSGNFYVADTGNGYIRKINANGTVSTIAGEYYGYTYTFAQNGKGLYQTSFYGPTALAIDPSGNVFVSDAQNHLIRKITPDTTVTTYAGKYGSYGTDDGKGTNATFMGPTGLATDTYGNVYVSDYNLIRKIATDGTVTTLAGSKQGYGDGKGNLASFNNPQGLAVDVSGNIFVADSGNDMIRKITPDGTVSTYVEKGKIKSPTAMTIDASGNLYVIDSFNNEVFKITKN